MAAVPPGGENARGPLDAGVLVSGVTKIAVPRTNCRGDFVANVPILAASARPTRRERSSCWPLPRQGEHDAASGVARSRSHPALSGVSKMEDFDDGSAALDAFFTAAAAERCSVAAEATGCADVKGATLQRREAFAY